MANNSYKTTFEPALLYGGIVGGVILLHSVVLNALDASFSTYAQITGYILPIALLFLVLHMYRKEQLGGVMSYSQSLGMGSLVMVVTGIISAVYMFVLIKYIDPDYVNVMLQIQEDKLLEQGMDEATIEKAMEMTSKMRSVGFLAVISFFTTSFFGVIFSAIVSIFLKKEPKDPFASVQ